MNVFDLSASLSLNTNEYEDKLNGAHGMASKIGGGIGKALGAGLAVAGTALTASAGAVVSLVKQSTEAFANYEQLVGGIETMFDDLSVNIEENANKAFKTAGLSANEYMETVMGFSASLNASLKATEGDISRSAELADQIIVDMADNANKMGSSMESIQNAYSGFAKQNYTMLDNLKLGYGGTKEEMQRLLDDANRINAEQGIMTEYSIENFSDIAEAIHVVQDEMGIAGTTAKEASTTIEGSINSMKGAWTNLIAGLGNSEADLDQLIDDLVTSAETVLANLLPVVERALQGLADVVVKAVPIIAEKLPQIVTDLAPKLLESASALLGGIVEALPSLIQVLIDQAPIIIQFIVDALVDNSPMIIECALKLIIALGVGLIKAIPQLLKSIPDIIKAIVKGLDEGTKEIREIGKNFIVGLWNGISDKIAWIKEKIAGFGQTVLDSIKGIFGIHSPSRVMRDEVGKMLALGLAEGWDNEIDNVKKDITNDLDLTSDVVSDVTVKTTSGSSKGFDFEGLVDAFSEALSQLEWEWDDRTLGRMVKSYA